jgi:hypothetical protein
LDPATQEAILDASAWVISSLDRIVPGDGLAAGEKARLRDQAALCRDRIVGGGFQERYDELMRDIRPFE